MSILLLFLKGLILNLRGSPVSSSLLRFAVVQTSEKQPKNKTKRSLSNFLEKPINVQKTILNTKLAGFELVT